VKRWGPAVVVVAVLAATAIAFATTERQKLEKTPFAVLHVSKDFSPGKNAATIALKFNHPHLLTLQIVDSHDRVVATLVQEERLEPGRASFRWRGPVADGLYEPKITLDTGRVFNLVNQIRADSTPPETRLVSYRPRVLRRHSKREVAIVYRVSEPAHVILYVNGRRELRGYPKALESTVKWSGRLHGRRLRPGRYRLQLAAVDLAGNVGPRTQAFVLRIRK
jgi:hypothetical protein